MFVNNRESKYSWKFLCTWIHEVRIPRIIDKSKHRIAPRADNPNFENKISELEFKLANP